MPAGETARQHGPLQGNAKVTIQAASSDPFPAAGNNLRTAVGPARRLLWGKPLQLCPCHGAPGAPHTFVPLPQSKRKPRPRGRLWPSPSLRCWHPPLPLSCIPGCSLGHHKPPARSLLRTSLRDERLSVVTSSCCPSVPAANAGTVPLKPETIPGRRGLGCPPTAPFQSAGAGTAAQYMSQCQNRGHRFLAGWAALKLPWMPTAWLKADPPSGLHRPAKQGSVSPQQQQPQLGAIR